MELCRPRPHRHRSSRPFSGNMDGGTEIGPIQPEQPGMGIPCPREAPTPPPAIPPSRLATLTASVRSVPLEMVEARRLQSWMPMGVRISKQISTCSAVSTTSQVPRCKLLTPGQSRLPQTPVGPVKQRWMWNGRTPWHRGPQSFW